MHLFGMGALGDVSLLERMERVWVNDLFGSSSNLQRVYLSYGGNPSGNLRDYERDCNIEGSHRTWGRGTDESPVVCADGSETHAALDLFDRYSDQGRASMEEAWGEFDNSAQTSMCMNILTQGL